MGLRFRKRISVGGFRINISKSGISRSFGVKGLRLTRKSKGGHRITMSIPNTGISYVSDSKKHKKKKKTKENNSHATDNTKIFEEPLVASQNDITKKITISYNVRKRKIPIICCISLLVFFWLAGVFASKGMSFAVFCLILAVISLGGVIISIVLSLKQKINYDYDDQIHFIEMHQAKLLDPLSKISQSQIAYRLFGTRDENDNIGATNEEITIKKKNSLIKSNIPIYSLSTQKSEILFLPDSLIVQQANKFYSFEYSDVELQYEDVEMPFPIVPLDSELIREKYAHETKKGAPDRRYQNNRLFYLCRCGGITIKNESGLMICLLLSNREIAHTFVDCLNDYKKYISSFC
ncbi:MAG: DUF4236 domain-containing protein [Clostridia bacterium]|nr:DUF4236 domain-containing protein [Clostridia bacterium]